MLYVDLFASRAIAMFAYDLAAKSLLIRFKTGEAYVYQGVPREIFDRFRQARSKGAFFHAAIRDRFVARRLAAGELATIARGHGPAAAFGAPAGGRVDIAALERPWRAAIFF